MASRAEKPVRPGTLGALIRSARGEMTQRELAESVTGDAAQFGKVSMWEHNKRLPAPEFIPVLIEVLGLGEGEFWLAYGRTMTASALGLDDPDDQATGEFIDQETRDERDPGNGPPRAQGPPR